MEYSHNSIFTRVKASKDLSEQVDRILDTCFEIQVSKSRLPRGWVHSFIANKLQLKINNRLCLMIRERILHKGARMFTNTAKYYYGNIRLKGE